VILVDTSVFIDFFAGKHSKPVELLVKSIGESADICTCGLIISEVLQGIRADKEYDRVKAVLRGLLYFPLTKEMFVHASSLYRTLCKNGKTIRSPVDCIIAALCLEHEISLIHNDRDFAAIAQYTSLKVVQ